MRCNTYLGSVCCLEFICFLLPFLIWTQKKTATAFTGNYGLLGPYVFFVFQSPLRRRGGALRPLALFIPPSHRSALKCSALKYSLSIAQMLVQVNLIFNQEGRWYSSVQIRSPRRFSTLLCVIFLYWKSSYWKDSTGNDTSNTEVQIPCFSVFIFVFGCFEHLYPIWFARILPSKPEWEQGKRRSALCRPNPRGLDVKGCFIEKMRYFAWKLLKKCNTSTDIHWNIVIAVVLYR